MPELARLAAPSLSLTPSHLLTFARPEICSPHSSRSYYLRDRVHRPCPLQIVLVSSILTDAGAWGQRGSPGFQITNAFGGVLDEKIVAEK